MHRQPRVAEAEARDDVGAARDRGEVQVALDRSVNVVELLRRERRPGGQHGAQRAEIEIATRCAAVLLEGRQVLRAGAERRDPLAFRHAPQHVAVRRERRALVEDQRAARGESADEPVPHHPAAGREEEQAVVGRQVGVQQVLLAMLQQRAAHAVHDALRHAGRARGIHHVQRRVERHASELQRSARAAELAEGHGAAQSAEIGRSARRTG